MKLNKLIAYLFVLMSLVACETEVDLFSNEDDVAVVFALLDQSDSVQYFRINPTFKGDGDAHDLAGNPDLTNYGDSVLDVRLVRYFNDNPNGEFPASEYKGTLRNDGILDPSILLFKLSTPVSVVDGEIDNSILKPSRPADFPPKNYDYQLEIKNKVNGDEYRSRIVLGDINDLNMLKPVDSDRRRSNNYIKFHTSEQYSNFTFQTSTIEGAKRYKLEMRYYYTEGTDTVPDSTKNFVNFVIGEASSINPSAGSVSFDFDGERFYQILNNALEPSDDRTGREIDLIVTAAGEDLDTYIEVQNASLSGLSQERPDYTNIENGIGVFSFRSTIVFSGFFLSPTSGKWMVDPDNPYTYTRFKCIYYGSVGDSRGAPACR